MRTSRRGDWPMRSGKAYQGEPCQAKREHGRSVQVQGLSLCSMGLAAYGCIPPLSRTQDPEAGWLEMPHSRQCLAPAHQCQRSR